MATSLSMETVRKEAEKEIREECLKKAKATYKKKLEDISKAKQVLRNLERELEMLEMELKDELDA